MFEGNPVGDRATEKIFLRECASDASYRQRERDFSRQAAHAAASRVNRHFVRQVVKSKNYRNVSGYVGLEFTESVVGFWGMRFPGDRIGSVAQPVAPAPNVTPSVVAAKPAVPVSVVRDAKPKRAESKFVIPAAPKVEGPLAQKPFAPFAP